MSEDTGWYNGEDRPPARDSMAWPVVFLLGLTALTVVCCLGSLYIVSGMFN